MNAPISSGVICEWPGCKHEAFCITGNVCDAYVCQKHFKITNGKTREQITGDELGKIQVMGFNARLRHASVSQNREAARADEERTEGREVPSAQRINPHD